MTKKSKPRQIPEVLIFSDPNHYPDALASLVVLAHLAERDLIRVRGLITEVGDYETRRRRAMYAKGALVRLGQAFWRVVPGGDYIPTDEAEENTYPETAQSALFESLGTAVLRSGTTFVQEYIKSAPSKNVIILLNAPFADFAKYVQTAGGALLKKLKKIVIMGSVQRNEKGDFQPEPTSYNFKVGAPAGSEIFAYINKMKIRTTIVTAQNVKDMQMGHEYLSGLENSHNPVAQELLAKKTENPVSMQYDMLSALALSDGELRKNGVTLIEAEGAPWITLLKIEDPSALRQKFISIFQGKFCPPKITLDRLKRPTPVEAKIDD